MTAEHAEIVPFGKYKGRPVVDLIADRSYTDWLAAQPWFRERYGNVYNLVINTGGVPQDSPEHNAMQARFLDHDEMLRLCRFYLKDADQLLKHWNAEYGQKMSDAQKANLQFESNHSAQVRRLIFESYGWDLRVSAVTVLQAHEQGADLACTCVCDPQRCTYAVHPQDLDPTDAPMWSNCYRGHPEKSRDRHCGDDCPATWRDSYGYNATRHGAATSRIELGVELKPTLGDDYPSVLREVLKRREMTRVRGGYLDLCVVLADTVTFTSVSYDKAQKIFRSQGVRLLTMEELPDLTESWRCTCDECTED